MPLASHQLTWDTLRVNLTRGLTLGCVGLGASGFLDVLGSDAVKNMMK